MMQADYRKVIASKKDGIPAYYRPQSTRTREKYHSLKRVQMDEWMAWSWCGAIYLQKIDMIESIQQPWLSITDMPRLSCKVHCKWWKRWQKGLTAAKYGADKAAVKEGWIVSTTIAS